MSTNTIPNEISRYLSNLTATNPICSALNTTLVEGNNLFMWQEPVTVPATQIISILPYSGGSPRARDKYESSVQIRIKAKGNRRAGETGQRVIESFHMNGNIVASANGVVLSNNSNPIFLPSEEGGEYSISVCNFTVRHTKLNAN